MKTNCVNQIDQSKRTLCEIWTRVMGYFRPVASWNKGKKSEFAERKYFKITS
jgi:anaerobic ribonucleoside-triphosphate reductase